MWSWLKLNAWCLEALQCKNCAGSFSEPQIRIDTAILCALHQLLWILKLLKLWNRWWHAPTIAWPLRKDEHAIAKCLKCETKKFCTADALCSCLSTMSPTDLDMELAGRRESSVHWRAAAAVNAAQAASCADDMMQQLLDGATGSENGGSVGVSG